ncbi:hypothetical protein GGI03_005258 [Coemansia sp. RSA 2337]|nr:hypothetical protein GGI03_005258 [Coemansia sp. RSA 2337]
MNKVFGKTVGQIILPICIGLSILGVVMSELFGGGRLMYTAGKTGFVPYGAVLGEIHPRFGTPIYALAIIWALSLVFLFAPPPGKAFDLLVDLFYPPAEIPGKPKPELPYYLAPLLGVIFMALCIIPWYLRIHGFDPITISSTDSTDSVLSDTSYDWASSDSISTSVVSSEESTVISVEVSSTAELGSETSMIESSSESSVSESSVSESSAAEPSSVSSVSEQVSTTGEDLGSGSDSDSDTEESKKSIAVNTTLNRQMF